MQTTYTAVKGKNGFTAYGPCGSVMHADANKVVTYSNMIEGSVAYSKLLKSIIAA